MKNFNNSIYNIDAQLQTKHGTIIVYDRNKFFHLSYVFPLLFLSFYLSLNSDLYIRLLSFFLSLYLFIMYLSLLRCIKNNMPRFYIYENTIEYIMLSHNDELIKKISSTTDIESISFCVISELHNSYGRFSNLTPLRNLHISKIFLAIYYVVVYILFALPYRIIMMRINHSSLSLLNKNIVVKFKNRNYFLINIYSQKDFDLLLNFFNSHNIPIIYKCKFIPQIQYFSNYVMIGKRNNDEFWSENNQ